MTQEQTKIEIESGIYEKIIKGKVWKERGEYYDTVLKLSSSIKDDGTLSDWHIDMCTSLPSNMNQAKIMLDCYEKAFSMAEKLKND